MYLLSSLMQFFFKKICLLHKKIHYQFLICHSFSIQPIHDPSSYFCISNPLLFFTFIFKSKQYHLFTALCDIYSSKYFCRCDFHHVFNVGFIFHFCVYLSCPIYLLSSLSIETCCVFQISFYVKCFIASLVSYYEMLYFYLVAIQCFNARLIPNNAPIVCGCCVESLTDPAAMS